jgi:LuxR family transcriptional regulator
MAEFAMAKAERLGLCPAVSVDEAIAMAALTEIQRDVLGWVAAGKSNLDIATILGMSERAVRHHVSEVLRKLGVVSRNQAATIFRTGKPLH